MERFPYEQVIGKELVRILTLEPGEGNDTVISSLEVINMKDAEKARIRRSCVRLGRYIVKYCTHLQWYGLSDYAAAGNSFESNAKWR